MATLPRTEHAVARSLAETADPRDACARALAAIGENLGWRFGAVWEPPADRPEAMRCIDTWQADGVDASEFAAATAQTLLARGEGLPGRVWQTGEPAWIADVVVDDNFPRSYAARRAGLHAAFCFPLRSARGVVGAIEFFTGEADEPDRELLETIAGLGDQIGQAVERRRDADALRAKEARNRAMLDAALDCVVTMDHDGTVIDFNPAAVATFGYSAEEVIGREMAALIVPPELRERHRAGLARYLASSEPRLLDRRIEITGMRADGSTFPVELTITRIDVPGPPVFTGYLRDITDRRRHESDLRASRLRLVTASDTARRRLERDLHDGAQQRLVELALDLRAARERLTTDPGAALELVDAALDDLARATSELRELARGIHPAALTEAGLRAALDALVGRCAVPTKLVAIPDGRFAAEVEATAYFVVAEGLTNVARYAGASRASVAVAQDDGHLVVEVRDDGRGGADASAGSGLRGLSDRVAALDGRVELDSPPGRGTTLKALIPCAS